MGTVIHVQCTMAYFTVRLASILHSFRVRQPLPTGISRELGIDLGWDGLLVRRNLGLEN